MICTNTPPVEQKNIISYWAIPGDKFAKKRNSYKYLQERIIKVCCTYFNIDPKNILFKTRETRFVKCRTVLAFFLKDKTGLTLEQIATKIGYSDHTMIHNKYNLCQHDPELKRIINELKFKI